MKKILAIILALALVAGGAIVLTSCNGNDEPETTTAADESTTLADESTTLADESTTLADESTTLADESTTLAEDESETVSEEATGEEVSAPATTDEILAAYNDAVNGAISAKAGYDKKRVTAIQSLEGGALMKIGLVQDAVSDFLGVGTKDYPNAKGKAEFMSKASLSASDVTSATCKEADGKYTITINLKDGSSNSSASGKSDSSPLKRSGLYVGEGDKSEYDYKNADNIYVALNGLDEASVEAVKLNATKGKIVAEIDAETGRLVKLTVSFVFNANLTKVKYAIASINEATGIADTTVTFSNFKY